MIRKTSAFVAMTLSLLLLLAACGTPFGSLFNKAAAVDLMAGVEAKADAVAAKSPDTAFIESVSDFSWNLFRQSTANEGNILISPASVYLALGMTLNGADADTRTAMLTALSASDLALDEMNRSCRDWQALLMKTNKNTILKIANSIWYRQEFKPGPDFLQRNADYYTAAVRALDFDHPSAPDTINKWVREATNGKIEKLVGEIDPLSVMFLINAVYFKADWALPFETAATSIADFKTPEGSVKASFMHRMSTSTYVSTSDLQGILLPYVDGRYAFFALLPEASGDPRDLAAGLDREQWLAILDTQSSLTVNLSLPKFEVRFEDTLKNELTALGMGMAFDAEKADFSLMNDNHAKDLFISEVNHKTYFRVDEKGTEAAAVTGVTIASSIMKPEPKVLNFNRPFLYGIVDTTTGLPLFLGILDNPVQ